ncbi:hypothetical protein ABZV77_11575 [Streptomyces sp. NPDC004732]|uniref:phage tail tube protein n=1 Tax=Streptomyces sp. NPDC004732 TaxID=3154290 RepID=UPI0033B8882F
MAEIEITQSDALVPATGFVFIAEANTPAPDFPLHKLTSSDTDIKLDGYNESDPDKKKLIWKSVGNTSLDNGIEMAIDGDDPETLGSWQVAALAATSPKKSFSLTINLHDITVETMGLYYGTSAAEAVQRAGQFVIPSSATAQKRGLLIVGQDATDMIAWYYPNTDIIGADSITLDPSALTEVPVKATIVEGVVDKDGEKPIRAIGKVFQKRPFKPSSAYFTDGSAVLTD